jgi:hypothetical protein
MSDKPDPQTAVKRIKQANVSDEDATEMNRLHGAVYTGEDDTFHYYIVMWEADNPEAPGETVLVERYAQLAKHDAHDDVFLKNGINRRMTTKLPAALASVYAKMARREDGEDDGKVTYREV